MSFFETVDVVFFISLCQNVSAVTEKGQQLDMCLEANSVGCLALACLLHIPYISDQLSVFLKKKLIERFSAEADATNRTGHLCY